MTFGEKLQKLRRQAGMSQEELAERLSVSRQAVSRWELEGTLPDAGKIVSLSRIFSVTTDYLLKDELEFSEPAETPPEPAPSAPQKQSVGKGLFIASCITGGLGALGFLVIAVLSSMIQSMVPYSYEEGGMTWYSTRPGYSFQGFIETYRLEAILWICGGLLIIGLLLFWGWWSKKHPPGLPGGRKEE